MSEEHQQLNGQPEPLTTTVCPECGTAQQRDGAAIVCELGHAWKHGISAADWDAKLEAMNERARARKSPVIVDATASESFDLPEQQINPGEVAMCRWSAPRMLRVLDVQHPESLGILEVIVNSKRSFSAEKWKGIVLAQGDEVIVVMVNRALNGMTAKAVLVCEHASEAPTVSRDVVSQAAPVPVVVPSVPMPMSSPQPAMAMPTLAMPTYLIAGSAAASYVGAQQQHSGPRAVFPSGNEIAVCFTFDEARAALNALKNNQPINDDLGSCIFRKLDNAIVILMTRNGAP